MAISKTKFLECFQSVCPIEKQTFFVYEIHRIQEYPAVNLISLARSIPGRINGVSHSDFYACTDDTFIYTKKPLSDYFLHGYNGSKPRNTYCRYELNLIGEKKISFSNASVYNAYIFLVIKHKLTHFRPAGSFFEKIGRDKYQLKNSEIRTLYVEKIDDSRYGKIMDAPCNEHPKIILSRNFSITPTIHEDGFFTLSIATTADYNAIQTFYSECKNEKRNPAKFIGRAAKYRLATGLSQTGIIVSEEEYRKANPGKDPQKDASVEATRKYLAERYSYVDNVQKALTHSPADDFILFMRINPTTVCQYLASTLVPILTTEYVGDNFSDFSSRTVRYIRLPMDKRIAIDQEFLADIGELPALGTGVRINPIPRTAEEEGYSPLLLETPKLRIGHNKVIPAEPSQKRSLFYEGCGFYRIPSSLFEDGKNCLRINILGDSKYFTEDALLNLLRYLYSYGGMRNCCPAFNPKNNAGFRFLPRAYVTNYHQEHGINAILKKIHEMNQDKTTDLNLIVINPNDPDLPGDIHNRIKKDLAISAMPSQMIKYSTVKKILKDYRNKIDSHVPFSAGITDSSLEYMAYNLIMQILAKIGSVPATFATPFPAHIDMILGLDVGMAAKGIHYPGCSVIFDGEGNYMGAYAPERAQIGEKISNEMLEEIFDRSLLYYEETEGKSPKRLLIMRDGFSNEDDAFYAQYFFDRGIQYNIVEVRKHAGIRLADGFIRKDGTWSFQNPEIGTALVKGKEGYIITTHPFSQFGAPQPLKIVHSVGKLPMQTIMQLCYCLTKNYPGSMQNIRLPLPTYAADKTCKAYDRVPHGTITDKNFFM